MKDRIDASTQEQGTRSDERPKLAGRRVVLRPLNPNDYEWLYQTALSEDSIWRWRYRGDTPSPEQFVQNLWATARAQFVVTVAKTEEPLGLVQGYGFDDLHQYAYLSVLLSADSQNLGWPLEGVVLFLRYLFHNWPLRKIYLEGPGPNLEPLATNVNTLFVEEGRLVDHQYFDNRLVDWVTMTVYRAEFEKQWSDKLAWFSGQGDIPDEVTQLRGSL